MYKLNSEALSARYDSLEIDCKFRITVDASDGPLENTAVNNMIPDNVEYNRNVYQLTKSGHSSYSSGSSAETSGSDSSIFPASHGGANYAENTAKTKVFNHNITSDKITHRNIDESTLDNNVKTIENFVQK